jgi:TPR repeat protein
MAHWKRLSFMMTMALVLTVWVHATALADELEAGKAARESGDNRTAMKLLQPLAERGNADAQFEVGMVYDDDAIFAKVTGNGLFGSEAQDDVQAAKWLRKAADQGHARAQYCVGTEYEEGKAVVRDLTEAAKWYRKAAEQGDTWAQGSIARMYWEGSGVKQDFVQAYLWWTLEVGSYANGTKGNSGLTQRDAVAAKMTPQQLAEGKRLVASACRVCFNNLGNARYNKGDLDGAIAEYRTAISQQPNDPETHEGLGNALDDKGDHDGAVAEYRTAISQRPNSPGTHYNLGLALARKGDLDGAIAEYRTAISQQPNYPQAQSALDRALAAKAKSGQ